MIGVCFMGLGNPIVDKKVFALQEFFRRHQLQTVLEVRTRDRAQELHAIENFRRIRVDGIVLTGSPFDMDPKRMGLPAHQAVQPMPTRREDADRALTRMVIDRQMPVLAIAVGMHELNVLCGGSLFMRVTYSRPSYS